MAVFFDDFGFLCSPAGVGAEAEDAEDGVEDLLGAAAEADEEEDNDAEDDADDDAGDGAAAEAAAGGGGGGAEDDAGGADGGVVGLGCCRGAGVGYCGDCARCWA